MRSPNTYYCARIALIVFIGLVLTQAGCSPGGSGGSTGSVETASDFFGTPGARYDALAERTTLWNPGVPGGVPARSIVCVTVDAARYNNGATDATAGIQSAIDACPAGQVVRLSAGTFRVDGSEGLRIATGISLRGAGPGKTILNRTNGAIEADFMPAVVAPLVIIGPSRYPHADNASAQNLTEDSIRGAYSVKVANGSRFAAGQFVIVDEDHLNTGAWQSLPNRGGQPTSVKIWATDRLVWQRHNPTSGEDDPFPDAGGWFSRPGRPLNEVKEVASVAGNVITFTTPLHIGYRVAYAAQLTGYDVVHLKNAGIEDLTVAGGSDGAVRFEAAAYSWAKNIDVTSWLGEGVAINHAFRVELRDSYVHHTVWPNPGGGRYAVSFAFGSSETLVENNIVMDANKVMVARAAGAGSVIGYNYVDDGFIGYDPNWVEVGINGSHMVGSHHMLFEGNYAWNYDSDNTHGSAIYHTVFRNHLSGYRRSHAGMSNARAAGLLYGSWWHSLVGNVLGTAGRMAGWKYEDRGTPWGSANYLWKLGYDPIHWDQDPDPKVRSTVLREGNYDYVTGSVSWSDGAKPMPDSLYLKAKPAFFGSLQWPWVDPIGATKLYTLPAKARFEALP